MKGVWRRKTAKSARRRCGSVDSPTAFINRVQTHCRVSNEATAMDDQTDTLVQWCWAGFPLVAVLGFSFAVPRLSGLGRPRSFLSTFTRTASDCR